MKKIGILFAMVVMIVLFAFSASALESTGQCGDNVYWSFDESTGELVISGEGDMFNYLGVYDSPFHHGYDIKGVIIKEGVSSIGENAFVSCSLLESVIIPDSVTKIGEYAFDGCYKLASVNISKNVVSIGDEAFRYCRLARIDVDENNECYSNDKFGVLYNKDKTELITYPAGNLKEEYIIPNGVVKIDSFAFYCCDNLKTIIIPASVNEIEIISKYLGSMSFYGCDSLENIIVDKNNEYYSSDEFGVLFNKDKTCLIRYPAGNTREEYNIPDSVISVADYSFESCRGLTNIAISDSVVSIGISAFEWCYNLTTVIIPCSITEMDVRAFDNCHSLLNITVDEKNNYYSSDEYGALFNKDKTKLIQYPIGNIRTEYTIPYGVNTIEDEAFYSCDSLVIINVPNSVTNINSWAFAGCSNLIRLSIPESVTIIENYAFYWNNRLTDVYYSGSEEQWNEIAIGNYNEVLASVRLHYLSNFINHYSATISLPTCTEKGYTTYSCQCGYSYVDDYTDKLTHEYISEITTPATHLTEGVEIFTCKCGDTYTESVAKLTEHNYNAVVTPPTCTAQGYTTYICECGASYVADYVGTKSHTYTSTVTRPATHLSEGVRAYTCSACGDTYTEAIAKIKEHNFVASAIVTPECEMEGYTVYICECGYSYKSDKISATGHSYEGDYCSVCGESKFENCSCMCHKSGFSGIIWKIMRFFYKLFGTNKTCTCGISHY